MHESGNGPSEDSVERPAAGFRPDAASGSVTSTVVVAIAAVLLVAATLFVVFADNALRGQSEIPAVLQSTASSPPHTPSPAPGGGEVVTPESIIIDLPLPEVTASEPPTPTVVPARTNRPTRYTAYIVEPGDTLAGIASRFGFSFEEIAAVNAIDEPFTIQIGETILIPNR